MTCREARALGQSNDVGQHSTVRLPTGLPMHREAEAGLLTKPPGSVVSTDAGCAISSAGFMVVLQGCRCSVLF
jgi:hypothetical protein